jgi:hypothetical protein
MERPEPYTDPHVLIVRDVGEPYTAFSCHEWEDWEIIHHDNCLTRTHDVEWNEPFVDYTCAVGYESFMTGVRWSLKYSGTPIEKPGRYLIDTWHDTIKGYGWTEYDGGLYIVEGPVDITIESTINER